MKYSIRGVMNISDGEEVNNIINSYRLWRLITKQSTNIEGVDLFTFEAWVNTVEDKDKLFNELKPYVDTYGEKIDWHECTHDEVVTTPCVIQEEYRKESV